MQQYLNYSKEWLEQHGAIHTAKEICQQPKIWRDLLQLLSQRQPQIETFLTPLLADPNLVIILTGAGSSAFGGVALAPWLREQTKRNVYAYGTTEIVADPLQYLSAHKKTLIVSFARSGNSPESVATVKLADQIVSDCYHLFLTCNPNCALTDYANQKNNAQRILQLVLPEGTHDLGFAMTSSISSMILATLLLLGGIDTHDANDAVMKIATICEHQLLNWQTITKQLAKKNHERVIYVGSSCFTGTAQEAALKILELTAGKIATRFDSILGLRHGPKFMINEKSLVVCFFSNDAYIHQYDIDLFNELEHDRIATDVLALSGQQSTHKQILSVDCHLSDCWLIFPYLVFAQMLAFEKSLSVGLPPDNPCPTGEVNRVVKGVTIYPFHQI
ncbi:MULTISPECIES: SIS domain-containing protein [unclassified Gilliamella]|uniref:SIS domain-containing protein n=1 Tax=unclassified Gilliamella TaxID=2685620 RepID=UPI00226AF5B9|nr:MULTISPECIES: SIS domain-containing protein [unclassified Gilliamella]MCX8587770.1 SIS domain-containing protein [Gilliamella sp. B3801]MCX8591618.1 SIS domain-containing protein [Gilliamella sp. B3804]